MGFVFVILVALCIQPSIKAQERSCSALLLKEPSTPSGSYTIDPDGPGRNAPFQVYCDMSKDGGVTLVSHDSENRTHVIHHNDPGSYKRIVSYINASVAAVGRLAMISVNCKQYIEYDCLHSRLEEYAWWVSRDNQARTYWGDTGINRGNDICECALPDNTCADKRKGCNCDINDHQWRSDSGYLSWKPDLPVIQLRFGDTNNAFTEEGYHTLGKLECSGQQDINDCDTNPCLNGGTCSDLENDFSCNCEPGYGGKICETDTDECQSNPCPSGAICTDKLNGYDCTCPAGKTCLAAQTGGEDECGLRCILIIMLSICIGITILCIIVISSGIKAAVG